MKMTIFQAIAAYRQAAVAFADMTGTGQQLRAAEAESSCGSGVSRRGGQPDVGGAGRGNHPAAGKDLAPVVEHDHSVAQQAPSLLGVAGDGAGGAAVTAVGRGARGAVGTHGAPLVWAADGLGRAGPVVLRAGSAEIRFRIPAQRVKRGGEPVGGRRGRGRAASIATG